MKVNNVSLAAVGVKMSQYPDDGKPEIAFAGKSNVGKSTLINAMIGRKALARTSSQPGKTRTINFYNVEDILYFVDLPGYGYAKAPRTEIEKWGKMIEEYLNKRETLRGIVMLVDIRHEPGENDRLMYDWLKHYGYDIIIAATKKDKIKRSQIQKQLSLIKNTLKLAPEDRLIAFSGETKDGVEELWEELEKLIGYEKTEAK
ncbi:MAG TPA: ribosome biogenesis GTP-binding protein YihA/YsxC [Firmicutes bacterium]|nr:ribosome biogenesis GTP-binding protein YihA/YsxC [Bacillota bacterium]